MLWGDQWECQCGWQNFELRKRCRNCYKLRSESFVRNTNFMGQPLTIEKDKNASS